MTKATLTCPKCGGSKVAIITHDHRPFYQCVTEAHPGDPTTTCKYWSTKWTPNNPKES